MGDLVLTSTKLLVDRAHDGCETLSIPYSGSIRTISILEAERVCRGDAWNAAD